MQSRLNSILNGLYFVLTFYLVVIFSLFWNRQTFKWLMDISQNCFLVILWNGTENQFQIKNEYTRIKAKMRKEVKYWQLDNSNSCNIVIQKFMFSRIIFCPFCIMAERSEWALSFLSLSSWDYLSCWKLFAMVWHRTDPKENEKDNW